MNLTGPLAKAHAIRTQHAPRLAELRAVAPGGTSSAKKDARGQLFIYDLIGESMFGGGVTEKSVKAELDKLGKVSGLDIFINSEGGSVYDGTAIYNLLKRVDAKKTVYVDGIAASAASFIAMVGDEIVMAENATMMIHKAQAVTFGSEDDHESTLKMLRGADSSIAGMYAARTGHPVDTIRQWMTDETWMTAAEAVKMKFADRIDPNASPVTASMAGENTPPLIRIASATQQRISAARVRLVDTDHSVLQDRRRASPERSSTQRPAARTQEPKQTPTSHGDRK